MEKIKNYNNYLSYKKDKLYLEKISLEMIAKRIGTPTYCYSQNQIIDNVNNLKKSFKKIKPTICYAVKANFNMGLRFAEFLGLKNEGLMIAYGPDKSDYLRMAKIYL